jgi:quercetin dioxygenase-like cupin family protein
MMSEGKLEGEKSCHISGNEWKTLSIPGVYLRTLRTFPEGGSTVLIKMDANSSFPLHDHQDEEETFVVEGEVKVGKYQLKQGDYLFTPPGTIHASHSKEGCILLALSRKPIKFLNRDE